MTCLKPKVKTHLLALTLLAPLPFFGCAHNTHSETMAETLALNPEKEITIPEGHSFLGSVVLPRYLGRWGKETHYFVQNTQTGQIFEFFQDKNQREIHLPEGHAFAGVDTWGKNIKTLRFYCRNLKTGRIYTGTVKTLAGRIIKAD